MTTIKQEIEYVGYFEQIIIKSIVGLVLGVGIVGWNASGALADSTGTLTAFDVPGASSTFPVGISPAGTVLGIYRDANYAWHGFLWTPTQQ